MDSAVSRALFVLFFSGAVAFYLRVEARPQRSLALNWSARLCQEPVVDIDRALLDLQPVPPCER
eukprot:3307643-Pyramimonas_sp.AAC.1